MPKINKISANKHERENIADNDSIAALTNYITAYIQLNREFFSGLTKSQLRQSSEHFNKIEQLKQQSQQNYRFSLTPLCIAQLLAVYGLFRNYPIWKSFCKDYLFANILSSFCSDLNGKYQSTNQKLLDNLAENASLDERLRVLAKIIDPETSNTVLVESLQIWSLDRSKQLFGHLPKYALFIGLPVLGNEKVETSAFLIDKNIAHGLFRAFLSFTFTEIRANKIEWLWASVEQQPAPKQLALQKPLFGHNINDFAAQLNLLRSSDFSFSMVNCMTASLEGPVNSWKYLDKHPIDKSEKNRKLLPEASWVAQKTKNGLVALILPKKVLADIMFRKLRAVWESSFDEIFLLEPGDQNLALVLLVRFQR